MTFTRERRVAFLLLWFLLFGWIPSFSSTTTDLWLSWWCWCLLRSPLFSFLALVLQRRGRRRRKKISVFFFSLSLSFRLRFSSYQTLYYQCNTSIRSERRECRGLSAWTGHPAVIITTRPIIKCKDCRKENTKMMKAENGWWWWMTRVKDAQGRDGNCTKEKIINARYERIFNVVSEPTISIGASDRFSPAISFSWQGLHRLLVHDFSDIHNTLDYYYSLYSKHRGTVDRERPGQDDEQ